MTPVIEGAEKLGGRLSIGEPKYAVAEYDFAKDGGAVGDINLRGDKIPKGAIVTDTLIEVQTKPTSGGEATIAVNSEAAGDLQAAKKVSEAPWSTATPKRGSLTATGTPVKTTAEQTIVATVATAALTAGKFRVIATYIELA